MKKRYITAIAILCVLSFAVSGCSAEKTTAETTQDTGISTTPGAQAEAEETCGPEVDYAVRTAAGYSKEDMNADYSEREAVNIVLAGMNTMIDGDGAAADGGVITITDAGTYIISGRMSKGQLVISAGKQDVVRLVLNNAAIHNDKGPAVCIERAKKTIIMLAGNSINELSDGEAYSDDNDKDFDAAVFAADDLTINGSGVLTVKGNYQHAIRSSGDLVITGGTLDISAVKDGLRGKDSVAIFDGKFTIESGGTGIKATQDKGADKGWISIDGGVLNINADDNGIQAKSALMISAADMTIHASKDALHSSADIQILGGDLKMAAGDDGMHADGVLYIAGGAVTVEKSLEAMEGTAVIVEGGNIVVTADDDGINAAGGNDDKPENGDPQSVQDGYYIVINGGNIYVNAQGDGIDSNGDIYIGGGTVIVDGPDSDRNAAIDIERGSFVVSGGTLIAAGTSGMLSNPTQALQPVVTIVFGIKQPAGSLITVTDSGAKQLFTIDPKKQYQSVMISSAEIEPGEAISILFGGTYLGERTNPSYYTGGIVSEEASAISLTLSGMITTIDVYGDEPGAAGISGKDGRP